MTRMRAGTRLRRAGADLDIIKRLLGRSTAAMSARYAHIGADEFERAVKDMPAEQGGKLRLV